MVCQIDVGLQSAGDYTPHNKAIYSDGRNELGEQLSSGIYYYAIYVGVYTWDTKGAVVEVTKYLKRKRTK